MDQPTPRKYPSHVIQPILTEDDVREIRKILKKVRQMNKKQGRKINPWGFNQRLGERYGVSARTISHLITGDKWRSVK
jgi:hypothetical protein